MSDVQDVQEIEDLMELDKKVPDTISDGGDDDDLLIEAGEVLDVDVDVDFDDAEAFQPSDKIRRTVHGEDDEAEPTETQIKREVRATYQENITSSTME